ncbi:MAG: ATP-binding protein [Acidimicrobiales bacterium]
MSVRLELLGSATEVAEARHRIARALEGVLGPERLDVVVLCASELLTNAVRHGGGPSGIEVLSAPGAVRVAVRDRNPSPPLLLPAGPEAESGRGLRIVEALSTAWGWNPVGGVRPARGDGAAKEVWFQLGRGVSEPLRMT